MKFGYKEIKEFAENHADERIRIMYNKICETRSRTAKWCDAAVAAESRVKELEQELESSGDGDTWREACGRLEAEVARLREENKLLRLGWCKESEKRQAEWWSEPVKTPVKWNTTTTGHTGCEYCNGTGQIAVTVTLNQKTRESQFGYAVCRNCNGKGY